MNLKDLQKFIVKEDKRSEKYYGHRLDKEKRVLARTVKLTEELGELASEVLAHYCLQRKQKLAKRCKDDLPEEFADVIITALLLAKAIDINIESALEKKMKKVNGRYKN